MKKKRKTMLPMVGVFTDQVNTKYIVGAALLKHQQWQKWVNNQNVALAHSIKIKKAFISIATSFN
jgi:hypothetical protein